jgi:deoxycytidylate deaminase
MGAHAHAGSPVNSLKGDLVQTFEGARSHDLVFAMVGHAGSGTTWVAKVLDEELSARKYTPLLIQVSSLIKAVADDLRLPSNCTDATGNPLPRPESLQNAGDELRAIFGRRIGAALAIRKIRDLRTTAPAGAVPAFIIDSLKNPDEVEALRDVYGHSFYVVSVLCRESIRRNRLLLKHKAEGQPFVDRLIQRDEAGGSDDGQHVRKMLHLGDLFVANERRDKKPLAQDLARFIEIVAGTAVVRPTVDERGMYAAWGASLQSSCLSRQVGAAIVDRLGNLISTGLNDAPRQGGGLYVEGESPDARCFLRMGSQAVGHCRNDVAKQDIYEKVFQALQRTGALAVGVSQSDVRRAIETTRVRDLIEFSRAVHAEMDAILSVARVGGPSVRGARLYCTTFPCHNCARGIIAAGIAEVVYVEPYPKSLARDLHRDAITEKPPEPREDGQPGKVWFRLFSGVAPRRFAALFEKRRSLKDGCGLHGNAPTVTATHNDPIFVKSHLDFERDITTLLNEALTRTRVA